MTTKQEMEEVRPEVITYDRPVMSIQEAEQELIELQEFIKGQMKEDTDFGIIPGVHKPSLWKPGAEKLVNFHGLSVEYKESPSTVRDWDNNFFNFDYKCKLTSGRGRIIQGMGSCNSKEKKYDKQDGYTIVNTIQKMAKKRAFIDAVLTATRASFYFTQDMEEVNDNKKEEDKIEKVPPYFQKYNQKDKPMGKKQYPITPGQRTTASKHNVDIGDIDDKTGFYEVKKRIADSLAKSKKKKPTRGNGKEPLIADQEAPPDEGY